MSRLEDKLTASIKPEPGKAPARAPAKTTQQIPARPRPATGAPSPLPDLNDPARPLHPQRIWPD